ncbi:non-ribosomal peptide synthetase [Burkholderia ubonensis]|uniref:non-ribosomal peptide synthetase n=1 Tax=Burkholderia ubonensis TaxID=101571 RepID=UPI0018E04D64|nr:non-ribosomal peptide synthetase [Burkholderia ubonensis]
MRRLLERRAPERRAPLSPAQERLWFLEQLQGSTGAYHLQVVLDFGQTLSIEALEGALNAIVARHEALRTRFVMEGGVPMQRVVPYLDVPLEQFDLRGLADPPAEAAARVAQGTARAFDLERGPLVRAWLLRIRDDQYRLLVVLHHIVSDGWSLGVLVRELNALYAAHAVGVAPALEPLPLQYPDYALWQRERLRNGGLDEHRQWWLAQLAGAPPLLDLPTDRPRPAVERANGAARAFVVPPALAARVRTLARAHDATLFMVLLAVFGALLARWSGRTDLVVGTPIAGRSRPELEGLIGFFVNMLALRIDARPEQRVEALIDQVRAVTVAAYEHQDVPFEQLVDALQPERSLSYAPVYQVAFALQNLPGERDANALPGGGEAVSEPVEGAARFDLTLSLSEQGEGLAGSCEYRTDLFDHATIGWLCGRYLAMLEAVVDDPGQPVGRLPMRAGSDPALPSEGAAVQAIGLTAASRVASVDDASSVLAAALIRTAKARRASLAKATHIVTTPEALAGLCAGDLPPAATLVVSGLPCFSAPLARWREQRLLGLWAPDGVPVARLALGEHEAVLAAALDGHRIDVVDAQGESQPCGVAGVLRIDGVETGWLARRRADGTIRVDGRVERIVRLQGVHADPQRALALLRQHPAVADAGVTVQSAGNRHDARLAAWVVPRSAGGIGAAELAEYAAEHLGAGLAPSSITLLDAAPGADWLDAERAHVRDGAPSTPIEALLARIWSDVLKRAQTDIDANFFDEGGNSVGSVQIIARIRDATRIDIPLHQLFEAPSIRQLARLIERQQHLALAPAQRDDSGGSAHAAEPAKLEPILRAPPGPRRLRAPLSFTQERLWFLDQFEGASALYNMAFSIPFAPGADEAAAQRALNEIVRRHETLRTVFPAVLGTPVQLIEPARAVPLERIRIVGATAEERVAEALALEQQLATRPFALDREPMLRARWLDLGESGSRLHLVTHHIVFDGWSFEILMREFRVLHQSYTDGLPSPLPEPRVQYADYARWQRAMVDAKPCTDALAYWRTQLADAPAELPLPFDHPRPPRMRRTGALHDFVIDAATCARLRQLARREGTTLFAVLLAAYQLLLMRLSGQQDVVVGTPVSNRTQVEVEPLIGFFANTLALRTRIDGDPRFAEVLRAVAATHLAALERHQVPFEKIVEAVQPERALNRNPLFQTMLVLQNFAGADGELRRHGDHVAAGVRDAPAAPIGGTAKFDLTLTAMETADGMVCIAEYSTELFEFATIERLAAQFVKILKAVATDPDQPALSIDLFTAADAQAARAAFGAAAFDPDEADVIALFDASASAWPDEIAIVHGARACRYAELERAAARVAGRLAALGVGVGDRVAIRMPRGIGMTAAVVGVLRIGAAYVPIDAAYPEERQRYIFDNSGARVLIAPPGDPGVDGVPCVAITIDGDLDGEPAGSVRVAPEAPAYVIYTSGSTGVPKGVVMTRRALANLIRWDIGSVRTPRPRTLQFAPLSFDVSFQEMLSTWALGATLVLVDEPVRRDPDALWCALVEHAVSRIYLPYVALQQLADAARRWDGAMPPLTEIVTAGEQLIVTAAIVALFERLDGAVLRNQYGPTETHVVTEQVLAGPPAAWPQLPPIGRPVPNVSTHVLDARMAPTPIGAPGELYIGGACVASGYHALPEQTSARFLLDPAENRFGRRLYRTGDRARRLADGSIQYLGRADQQVKVRGFRIEPGEIEAALTEQPGVADAAVVAAGDSAEARRLVALVVPSPGVALAPAALQRTLARRLPEHMVPASIAVVDRLPLTPSGKVDRATAIRLAGMAQQAAEPTVAASPLEALIAKQWAELLTVDSIGVEQDFFAAGGHSLLAMRALSRLGARVGIDLPVSRIFEASTPRKLAAVVVTDIVRQLDVHSAQHLLRELAQRFGGEAVGPGSRVADASVA